MANKNHTTLTDGIDNHSEIIIDSPFFKTTQDMHAHYTHCPLCNAFLHFSHITDFSKNLTQETTRCPECILGKTQRFLHRLQ